MSFVFGASPLPGPIAIPQCEMTGKVGGDRERYLPGRKGDLPLSKRHLLKEKAYSLNERGLNQNLLLADVYVHPQACLLNVESKIRVILESFSPMGLELAELVWEGGPAAPNGSEPQSRSQN